MSLYEAIKKRKEKISVIGLRLCRYAISVAFAKVQM